MIKTRKAFKNLQYSPKGQDIAGTTTTSVSKSNLNLKSINTKSLIMKNDSSSFTPFKANSKIEEKENPITSTATKKETKILEIQAKEYQENGIQCNKLDEDMLTGDYVPQEYWKLMVIKRKEALHNAINENTELHEVINKINKDNESLREENKDLLLLLKEVDLIRTMINEQEGVGDGDSGYAVDSPCK